MSFTSGAGGDATYTQDGTQALSCAAFPPTLNEQVLIDRYGRAQVVASPVHGADDGPEDGPVVFPESREARLEIVWQDLASREDPGG